MMKDAKMFQISVASFLALGLMTAACTESHDRVETKQVSDQAQLDASKAAAEAEAAEEEFAKSKHSKSKHAKRATASVKKSSAESIYLVQVGTYSVEENAKKMEEKLKTAGLPAFQKKIERESGAVFYTVRLEPTPNHQEAESFVASVKKATGEAALILSVGR